jgi:hypothetical protein
MAWASKAPITMGKRWVPLTSASTTAYDIVWVTLWERATISNSIFLMAVTKVIQNDLP